MGYEDSVYLAKLAEQAERYEGKEGQVPQPATRGANQRPQRWSRT